jgi:hypothetical protein
LPPGCSDRAEPRQRKRAIDRKIDGCVGLARRHGRELLMQRAFQHVHILARNDGNRKDRRVFRDRPDKLLGYATAGFGGRVRTQVDLRNDDEHAAGVEKLQNRKMLERLRHDAFIGVHDEQQQLHARGAREHVVQEALVAGHVHDAALDSVLEAQVCEPEIERHAALVLFDPAIGVRSGEGRDERGLPMVDVSGRSNNVHGAS